MFLKKSFFDDQYTPLHSGPHLLGGEEHLKAEIFCHTCPLFRSKGRIKPAHFDGKKLGRRRHTLDPLQYPGLIKPKIFHGLVQQYVSGGAISSTPDAYAGFFQILYPLYLFRIHYKTIPIPMGPGNHLQRDPGVRIGIHCRNEANICHLDVSPGQRRSQGHTGHIILVAGKMEARSLKPPLVQSNIGRSRMIHKLHCHAYWLFCLIALPTKTVGTGKTHKQHQKQHAIFFRTDKKSHIPLFLISRPITKAWKICSEFA